jgi:hypothetical protein
MASKEKNTTPAAPEFRILIELSRRARVELNKLLRVTEAVKTIDSATFNAGLEKAEAPLRQMLDYIEETLQELSKLKQGQAKMLGTKNLNVQLEEVGHRVQLMFNHSEWYRHK